MCLVYFRGRTHFLTQPNPGNWSARSVGAVVRDENSAYIYGREDSSACLTKLSATLYEVERVYKFPESPRVEKPSREIIRKMRDAGRHYRDPIPKLPSSSSVNRLTGVVRCWCNGFCIAILLQMGKGAEFFFFSLSFLSVECR